MYSDPVYLTPVALCVFQYLYPTVEDFVSNGFVMSVVALVAALAQGTFSQCHTHVMVSEGVRLRSEIQVGRCSPRSPPGWFRSVRAALVQWVG